jgi:hypothetical protein
VARTSVVEQHAPHHLRGNGEELRAAFPARMLITQAQPRFMYERGGLESVSLVLAPQGERGLTAKLRVDEPDE